MVTDLGEKPRCIGWLKFTIVTMVVLIFIGIGIRTFWIESDFLYVLLIIELLIIQLCSIIYKRYMSRAYDILAFINKGNNLDFSIQHTLGFPGVMMLSFDTKNHKVVCCNVMTRQYQVNDFSYITSWQLSYLINTNTGKKKAYLSLTARDDNAPNFKVNLPIKEAEYWNARLDHILNG